MKKFVLIMAAGKGSRMQSDLPKQFLPLNGKPMLMHTLMPFLQCDENIEFVLVLPEEHVPYLEKLCARYSFHLNFQIVFGGAKRFFSVQNGLRQITGQVEKDSLIAVHDAARPLVNEALVKRCFDVAAEKGSAVPVIPLKQSIRRILPEGSNAEDRNQFYTVQTPQVFRGEDILTAYKQDYREVFTDDASVMEAAGFKVHLTEGLDENIKITTPADMAFAEYKMKENAVLSGKMVNENSGHRVDRIKKE